jgi:hypothetical protein
MVRLHIEGEWSLGRIAKATDRLADRLVAWKLAPVAGELSATPS